MDNPNMTQTRRILDHLKDTGSITNVEAQAMYKARSITRRIADIRQMGYDVLSEWKTDHTGQRYVRYWLRSKTPNVPIKFSQVKDQPVFTADKLEDA